MANVTRCDGCGKLSDDMFKDKWLRFSFEITYPGRHEFGKSGTIYKDVCSKQCAHQVLTEELANKNRYYHVREHSSHA